MVENIQGKELFQDARIQHQKDIQSILNNKKAQKVNPYSLPLFDQTEISEEAITLFERDNEVEFFKEMAKNEPDIDVSKVAKLKALYESGLYKVSNEDLADSLLENSDFKALLGF